MNNPLAKKFQFKDDFRILIINSDTKVLSNFEGIAFDREVDSKTDYDSVILFSKNEKEVKNLVPDALQYSKSGGQFWLTYPKKSGNVKTDLNRDITWKAVAEFGLEPVRLISLNDDWSSMRLVKASERKKPSTFGQDPPGVDRTTKTVVPPDDLAKELTENPVAKEFFEGLAFSHKREYVAWIHQAKKEETRIRRVAKTIELLNAKQKTK